MRKKLAILAVLIFFFQVGYLFYHLPQIILLGLDFTPEVKLAAVIAGICLGLLLLLKEYNSPLE